MPNAAERALSRERLRRRRDALLLELGGLVYELHRQGRRSPELLQSKAAELEALEEELARLGSEPEDGQPGVGAGDASDAGLPLDGERDADDRRGAARAVCPTCGEPAEAGQLVCLNCGSRLDAGRQPKAMLPALAALIAVVVIGAGAFGFALSELTSGDSSDEEQPQAGQSQPDAPPAPSAQQGEQQTEARAEGTVQQPSRSLLLEWPRGLRAHTVVLVNTSDRAAARGLARQAARSGIEAGLLRSDDYDLGTGLWIVFAGRFDTRRGAVRQAANLDERYPGAYVQLIGPAG